MNTRNLSLLVLSLLLSGCGGLFNGTIVGDGYNTVGPFIRSSAGENWSLTIFGGIYSHTIQPLTLNQDRTEVCKSDKKALGRINQFQYPSAAVLPLSVRLGKNGLGDVAKEHGINSIYYADIERWTVLFGLWSREAVHIYGQ